MRHLSAADRLDSWWLRARFTTREKLRPAQTDPDIILVEMDDLSTRKWPEPILFWGPHFAAAITNLTQSGARLIALDYIQAIPVTDIVQGKGLGSEAARNLFDTYDQKFSEALAKAPKVVMAKQEYHTGTTREWIRPTPQLLYSLPDAFGNEEKFLGYADTAADSVVSAIPPAQYENGKIVETSLAARIVESALGAPAQLIDEHWTIPGQVSIPLRENGTVYINYGSGSGTQTRGSSAFQHFSLYDVAQPMAKPNPAFKNKIVLIGATYRGSNDDHFIPFLNGASGTRRISGVEMQANFVRTLLRGDVLTAPDALSRWLLALLPALTVLLAFYSFRWTTAALYSAAAAAIWICTSFFLFVTHSYLLPINLALLSFLLCGGLMGGYRALGEERERSQVLSLWGRYQDPRLVNYLLQHPNARGGQGREMEVTVLFADLKNFTKTVEHLSPTDAIKMLNRYLALMTEVVLKYDGYVDKYLGDGLMAQWGAPEPWSESGPHQNHATAAVRACLELENRTRQLTEEIQGASANGSTSNQGVTFGLRLTLHSGPVVVGWVGAEKIEFTIIGDTVNVCARLQETAKQLNCEFLISESTYEQVCDEVKTGRQAEVEIRGRNQPLRVYEICEPNEL
jgi:adenylate cyclase